MPPQSPVPPPPQVIYQDIRSVTQPAPTRPASPADSPEPEISVEDLDLTEESLPDFDDRGSDEPENSEELSLELEEDDEIFFIEDEESLLPDTDSDADIDAESDDDGDSFPEPESDVLSEDLPEEEAPVLPDADLVFNDNPENDIEIEPEPEDLEVLEPSVDPTDVEPEEQPQPAPDSVESEKMLQMFRYLSSLTDEAEGDGRKKLIEDGVPLKIAGVTARLSGEPKLREVAQKFDRRSRERHNVELNEERIRESLNAFKSLADAFPGTSVRESLGTKLGKILNFVSGQKKPEKTDEH
jgi:hypothetical protein